MMMMVMKNDDDNDNGVSQISMRSLMVYYFFLLPLPFCHTATHLDSRQVHPLQVLDVPQVCWTVDHPEWDTSLNIPIKSDNINCLCFIKSANLKTDKTEE